MPAVIAVLVLLFLVLVVSIGGSLTSTGPRPQPSETVTEVSATERRYQRAISTLQGLRDAIEKDISTYRLNQSRDNPVDELVLLQAATEIVDAAQRLTDLARSGLADDEVILNVSNSEDGLRNYLSFGQRTLAQFHGEAERLRAEADRARARRAAEERHRAVLADLEALESQLSEHRTVYELNNRNSDPLERAIANTASTELREAARRLEQASERALANTALIRELPNARTDYEGYLELARQTLAGLGADR